MRGQTSIYCHVTALALCKCVWNEMVCMYMYRENQQHWINDCFDFLRHLKVSCETVWALNFFGAMMLVTMHFYKYIAWRTWINSDWKQINKMCIFVCRSVVFKVLPQVFCRKSCWLLLTSFLFHFCYHFIKRGCLTCIRWFCPFTLYQNKSLGPSIHGCYCYGYNIDYR